ncbi:hypothetical protein F4859DRAFT_392305 [Xylaria cf. heliscus]|nr:hypothetical protein F4859DRAFT_392305 [Xylaria cf. heliscus]
MGRAWARVWAWAWRGTQSISVRPIAAAVNLAMRLPLLCPDRPVVMHCDVGFPSTYPTQPKEAACTRKKKGTRSGYSILEGPVEPCSRNVDRASTAPAMRPAKSHCGV